MNYQGGLLAVGFVVLAALVAWLFDVVMEWAVKDVRRTKFICVMVWVVILALVFYMGASV